MLKNTPSVHEQIDIYITETKKSLDTVVSSHARMRVEKVLSEELPKVAIQWKYIESQTMDSPELREAMIDWMRSQLWCITVEEHNFSTYSEEHTVVFQRKRDNLIRFIFGRILQHPVFSRLSREEIKEMVREAGRRAGVELQ